MRSRVISEVIKLSWKRTSEILIIAFNSNDAVDFDNEHLIYKAIYTGSMDED